jgi:hypothetical protein
MNNEYKFSESEMDELKKMSSKSDLLKKVYELIDLVQSNSAIETFVALKKSHTELCEELIQKGIKLFNSDNESVKDFDNFQKFKLTALDTVTMIEDLRKKLLPEEEVVANKKIKNSAQGFLNKAPINGSTN